MHWLLRKQAKLQVVLSAVLQFRHRCPTHIHHEEKTNPQLSQDNVVLWVLSQGISRQRESIRNSVADICKMRIKRLTHCVTNLRGFRQALCHTLKTPCSILWSVLCIAFDPGFSTVSAHSYVKNLRLHDCVIIERGKKTQKPLVKGTDTLNKLY